MMSTDLDVHFETLDKTVASAEDHDLVLRYAPRIRFDAKEPFLPSAVGFTVFRETGDQDKVGANYQQLQFSPSHDQFGIMLHKIFI